MIIDVDTAAEDLDKVNRYREFVDRRRKNSEPAKIFSPDQDQAGDIADLLTAGGVVAMPWGARERKIMILTSCFDNSGTSATSILNEIKGRPPRQVLGIGCLPESVHFVAEVEQSRPLRDSARRLFKVSQPEITHIIKVLDMLFNNNSVGLLLKAKDILPDEVTSLSDIGRTVLILGANDCKDPNDIYTNVLWELSSRFGKVLAGTSANQHGASVYSVTGQRHLFEDVKFKVDGFVMFDRVPRHASKDIVTASSTAFDLTGDRPVLYRWGSQHPSDFKKFFPDLSFPEEFKKEVNREGKFGFLKRNFKNKLFSFLPS